MEFSDLTWSVPVRFAFMFLVLFLANREFNIFSSNFGKNPEPAKNFLISAVALAVYTFIAGALLYEALVEIVHTIPVTG